MIRKFVALAAALVCAAGLSLAGVGAATASVVPVVGSYNGVDHHSRAVSFSFNGTSISHLVIGHITIGATHVGNDGQWDETCGGGYCSKGHWITETHVTGYWRVGGSHTWTSFDASTTAFRPYVGTYMGRDHSGRSIHLSYANGILHAFTWNGQNLGSVHVDSTWHFSGSHNGTCFRGHWQTATYVVGEVRSCHVTHGTPFDANAYSP